MPKQTLCISIIFLFLCLQSVAQKTCNCPEFIKFNKDKRDTGFRVLEPGSIRLLSISDNIICRAKSFEIIAGNYTDSKQFDSAMFFLNKAEELYKKSGCSDEAFINCNSKWVKLYFDQGKFKESLDYLYKNLPVTKNLNDKYEYAFCLLDIARVFCLTNQPAKGAAYARLAMPEIEKVKDAYLKAYLCFNLANRFIIYANEVPGTRGLDTANTYARLAIELGKQSNNLMAVNTGYYQLGAIGYYTKDYLTAIRFADSSLRISKLLDNHNMIAGSFFDMADGYLEMGNLKEARRLADSSLFYNKLYKHPEFIAEAYSLITDIALRGNNYKDAVTSMQNEKLINDSLHSVENSKAINELEQKYNKAQNESKIKDLSRQKQLYLLLALAGLFAVAAIAFFLRQQQLKHKKNILETEQRLNRARMNPHFFFNALTTLQKFALRDNDGQAMASNLSKFSNIMRETLESTYKEYVTIEQEIDFLNEYLEVQKIRFPQTFSYKVLADKDMEIDELQIPAMIIQPFVENIIEHGFVGVDYAGKITVHFTKDNKELLIQITDNGKGLNTVAKENNEHISRASQIIKDRIYLLNIKLKTKAGFSIDNASTGNGVVVKIHLPLLYNN
jgi:anti-sigma regulatory factor (Ser/Thr protein kinase)/tetratricopeptide (TPR) repeat protein